MTILDDTPQPSAPADLPHWDLSDLYPGLDSRELTAAFEGLASTLTRLEADFDELDVRASHPRIIAPGDDVTLARAIIGFNAAMEASNPVRAYVYATVSTDSTHALAQSLFGRLSQLGSRLAPLQARLAGWVADRGAAELAVLNEIGAEHAGPLRQLAERAEHQMPESDEHLYAELRVTGSTAWGRLHNDVTSQLSGDVALPEGTRRLPMPAIRGLATDPDPAVRRAAYECEMATWPQAAVPCAAAMNSIKGEAIAVNRRRGWPNAIDPSLFANSVSRPTFEAMQRAVADSLGDFRRWMRAKAALHGHDGALPWWDLFAPAPTPGADRRIGWGEGMDIVRSAFDAYSAPLAGFVSRAVDQRWIDAEPRRGKAGGAFCMSVGGDRSMILLNWSGSIGAASTAAHELGHAWHNVQLAERTPLQRMLPMALAETASIFCETLVFEEALGRLSGVDRLAMLDANLQGANQVVVDIHSRFVFETAVFDRRAAGPLGSTEYDRLMLDAQASAYGDGLDQTTAHPHMWIVKPHYYGSHFYNWPYTYGQLFGTGLYSRYRADPERFRAGYDTMLSRAGMDTAEELAASFGFDVTDEAFWSASLDVMRAHIDDYVALAGAMTVGTATTGRRSPSVQA